jgi:hypothetical protein
MSSLRMKLNLCASTVLTPTQLAGSLANGVAFGQKLHHFAFPWSQCRSAGSHSPIGSSIAGILVLAQYPGT